MRSLHGVQVRIYILKIQSDLIFYPLELDKELYESANSLAEINARDELMYHSTGIDYKDKYDKNLAKISLTGVPVYKELPK